MTVTTDLKNTINYWIEAMDQYTFTQFIIVPKPGGWSIGQIFVHLVSETTHFLKQAKICLTNNENMNEQSSPEAKQMFRNNSFPDIIIEGPSSNALVQQPLSKASIKKELLLIKNEIDALDLLLLQNSFKGKTKHPGLNYFDAREWIQFADMHMRHHLRQKKRIDEYILQNNP